MLRFFYEHHTHHLSISQNYTILFASKNSACTDITERKKRFHSHIIKKGGRKLLKSILKSQYGLRSSSQLNTHLFFLPTSFIASLFTSKIMSLHGISTNLFYHLSFIAFAQLWIFTSSSYHPLLHKGVAEIKHECSALLRLFIFSRFSRFIAQSHKTHHSTWGKANQNLNPFFDFVFGWQPLSIEDFIDLKNRKALY